MLPLRVTVCANNYGIYYKGNFIVGARLPRLVVKSITVGTAANAGQLLVFISATQINNITVKMTITKQCCPLTSISVEDSGGMGMDAPNKHCLPRGLYFHLFSEGYASYMYRCS